VVSLDRFDTSSWAPTAALVSSTTSLPVTAVVLTKIDMEFQNLLENRRSVVERAFWKPGTPHGPVLACSIIAGKGAKAVCDLAEAGGKPPFDSLQVMPFAGVSLILLTGFPLIFTYNTVF
jgi:hypothetical protein